MNETIHFKKFLRLIGQNFYAVRIAHNKDLETVAEEVKILPEVLEQIEYGDYNWEVGMIARLCSYYGVSIGEIIQEQESVRG